MSFPVPDIQTLIDRARADINARLPGADARLPVNNLNVLSMVHSAGVHGLYGYLQWLSRQMFVDTCEAEFLDRRGAIVDLPRKLAARATGSAVLTGSDGTPVPAGTLLVRTDGVRYVVTASGTIIAGTATVPCEASEAGAGGNFSAGTLSLLVAVAGLNSSVSLSGAGFVGGADIETDEPYRARILARLRKPPMGGAAHDYVAWALAVPGVTRAWVYPLELGLGSVVVRFVRDNDASLIPDAGEVAAVQAYINTRKPVTAAVTVVAPIAQSLNFTIAGLSPDTPEVRAAVVAELRDLLQREAEPNGTILISHIREAISSAAGESNHTLVSPAADVLHTGGKMAVMGAVTWV